MAYGFVRRHPELEVWQFVLQCWFTALVLLWRWTEKEEPNAIHRGLAAGLIIGLMWHHLGWAVSLGAALCDFAAEKAWKRDGGDREHWGRGT